MRRPLRVTPLPEFQLEVEYQDGVVGTISLADLVGHGVFAGLVNPEEFARVKIGEYGQIMWSDEMEICPDATYHEIVARNLPVHA